MQEDKCEKRELLISLYGFMSSYVFIIKDMIIFFFNVEHNLTAVNLSLSL